MQKEYKVQKGESLQDVVLKLYGSLEYQLKFITDNNLGEIDTTQPQLYQNDNKISLLFNYDNYVYNAILTKIKTSNGISYNTEFTLHSLITASIGLNNDVSQNRWVLQLISNYCFYYTTNVFPFSDGNVWTNFLGGSVIKIEPYFEPFNVVYDDSIIKSVVPAITPAQMNTESNLKSLKVFNGQSFYDISLMAHGDLENSIKLAYDNNIDINTFDYSEKNSIIYYNTDIKNTLIHNFMNTLEVKPSTIYKEVVAPAPSGHIAFNESFNVSFN